MRPWGAQYRALRDGYSFNTALPVDTDQDPLRVDRQTADVVQLSGDRTTAALKDHGTHVCLVRLPRRAARMQRPSARLSLRQACRRVWLAHGRRGPPLSHGTRACQAAPSCVGGSGAGRCDAAHGSDRRHALTRCVCWRLGRTPIHMEQAGIRAVPCQCLSPGVSTVYDAVGRPACALSRPTWQSQCASGNVGAAWLCLLHAFCRLQRWRASSVCARRCG